MCRYRFAMSLFQNYLFLGLVNIRYFICYRYACQTGHCYFFSSLSLSMYARAVLNWEVCTIFYWRSDSIYSIVRPT